MRQKEFAVIVVKTKLYQEAYAMLVILDGKDMETAIIEERRKPTQIRSEL